MSILRILHYPDKHLRIVADPVIVVNTNIQRIVDNMLETMYSEKGIGLAATQVNIHQRIVVIDLSENCNDQLVLINPELLEASGISNIEEGCLSIPMLRAIIPRFDHVKIRALDYTGKKFEIDANKLLAVCIQHEMDHLIGKLFIDYLSPLKRQRFHKKIKKLSRMNTQPF